MTESGTLNGFWMKWTSSGVSLHIGFLASMTDNTSRIASSSLFCRTCTSSSFTSEPIKKLCTISICPSQLKCETYNHITLFIRMQHEVLCLNMCGNFKFTYKESNRTASPNHHAISPLFRHIT